MGSDKFNPLPFMGALAATILLRGAAEQTVAAAKSKYYPHAVRYIKTLIQLADRVDDWKQIEAHTDWYRNFRLQHSRKSALMSQLPDYAVREQDAPTTLDS